MSKKCFRVCGAILALALSVSAQGTIDKYGVYHPTEEEIAANKRRSELLKHPTFTTLRLVSTRRSGPHAEPSTTPSPYLVGDYTHFQLLITQYLSEEIVLSNYMSSYYDCRPELYKDGDILPYSKQAQEKVERPDRQVVSGSVMAVRLVPGRERLWTDIDMDDWYEPLGPGHYQLSVRKRFTGDGDWVQSNPVTFDVQARKPATPIPSSVAVRLLPSDFQEKPEQKLYRLRSEASVTILVVNNSDQRINVDVIDLYYGNRLQLFKD